MAYQVTYYHDDEDNAGTDSITVGPLSNFHAAVKAANQPPSERWNGGASIQAGHVIPGKLGVRPDRWEDDEAEGSWYVYDGVVQR